MTDHTYTADQKGPSRVRTGLVWIALLFGAAALMAVTWFLGLADGESVRFNYVWSRSFAAEFWQGALYPRHLPTLWEGLGGLDLYFYGPMPFWLTELLARPICVGCSDDRVLALFGAIGLLLSGLTFYIAARGSVMRSAALGGALIYMVLPYHLWVDWVHRQAAGEFTAFIFAPLFFLGSLKILRGGGGSMFAIGLAGMMFSHLPAALLAVHVLVVIGAVWVLFQILAGRIVGMLKGFGRTVLFGLIGGALAAVYWVPAIALLGDVSSNWLYLDYFQPERWLFLDGDGGPNPEFELRMLALLGLGGLMALLPVLLGAWRGQIYWLFVFLPVVTVAVSMSFVAAPLWQNWYVDLVQFPWRSLVVVDFAAAFAVALAIHFRPYGDWPMVLRLGLFASVLAGMFLTMPEAVRSVLRGPINLAEGIEMAGAAEYTPAPLIQAAGVDEAPDHRWLEKSILQISRSVHADATIIGGDLSYRQFTADIPDGETAVTLRVPYWQHWQGQDQSGAAITLAPEPRYGLTFASVPAGTTQVRLNLPWHISEKIGLALSGLALLCLVISALPRRRRRESDPAPAQTPLAGRIEPRI
ncbi:MAG: hypothetical protein AAF557_14335 [Pseudomonadota bacterium]